MKKRKSSSSSPSPDRARTEGGQSAPLPFVEERAGGLFIRVRLAPRASREQVDGVINGALKIRLTAPPVEGEANKSLIRFLSALAGLPKSSFSIAPGTLKSKDKQVKVAGCTAKELCSALRAGLDASGLTA